MAAILFIIGIVLLVVVGVVVSNRLDGSKLLCFTANADNLYHLHASSNPVLPNCLVCYICAGICSLECQITVTINLDSMCHFAYLRLDLYLCIAISLLALSCVFCFYIPFYGKCSFFLVWKKWENWEFFVL